MAGTIVESELTARPSSAVRFALAQKEDDLAIRRLLRNNPMRGAISVSFEREPGYFQGVEVAGAVDKAILAFENDRPVCMGRCSIRDRYINGETHRVGYLSDLRLDSSVQGRFDILRRGYQFFHELERNNPADFYFTSITMDNSRSLRLLQRGLPGMPRYEPLADFVTLFVPVPGRANRLKESREGALSPIKSNGLEWVPGTDISIRALVDFLNSRAGRYHLAAAWTEENLLSLQHHGLSLSDFKILMNKGEIIGCAGIWDQRDFKQIVIRGYDRRLSLARPLINLGARLFGFPQLPPVGSIVAHGVLSPLAVAPDEMQSLPAMIELSLSSASRRGLEFLCLGFANGDPHLAMVRKRFRCREYRNRLFQVIWKSGNSAMITLSGNLISPEVALL
jgi:hypothetical protein